MESIEQLNNQLRVLKQAVLQEKDQRKEKAKLTETIKSQIGSLEMQSSTLSIIFEKKLKEKNSVEEELRKAQDSLKAAQIKANPLKKSFGSSKSIIALQAQNEKLKEEYRALQADHKRDEEFISKLKKKYSQYYEQIAAINRQQQELNEKCAEHQESALSEQKKTKDELENISFQKLRIAEKNEEFSENIEKLRRKNERLAQDLDNLKQFISMKTELENKLQESLKKHEKVESDLMAQIQEAKADFFDSKSFMQVFPVKVTCLMMQCQGFLVLKKSENNEFLLEIVYKGKTDTMLLRQIEDIYEHPVKENRVVIKYKSKTKDILTEQNHLIISRVRELQKWCNINLR